MKTLSLSLRLAPLLGLVVALAPAPLGAQQRPAPGPAARVAAEVDAWLGELETLHARLEGLQLRALEDPQIGAAQSELGERIKVAMEKADPTLSRGLARMEAMEVEAATAREKRDTTRLQQLGAEAEQIGRQFEAVQARVLQQPDIARQVTAFQDRLQRRMLELDADAARVVSRFRELEARLAEVSRSAGP